MHCASCTVHQSQVIRGIPRTCYCFSIIGPGKEVVLSLALKPAWWPIFLLQNFGVQIISFKLEKLKKFIEGKKKIQLKSHKKPITRWCKVQYDFESNITQGTFCCLKLRNFSFHISNCSICLRISTHQIFSSSNLKPSPSATSKCILNPWNDVCDSCLYRYQWGKFGSSYLLHKHSDLSFEIYFSKQTLVGNI